LAEERKGASSSKQKTKVQPVMGSPAPKAPKAALMNHEKNQAPELQQNIFGVRYQTKEDL